jgi:hypothetical protein
MAPTAGCPAAPTLAPTSAPSAPGLSEAELRQRRLGRLADSQEQTALPLLVVIGFAILAFMGLLIFVSKVVYKDRNANYVTILQTGVSVFDYISDVFLMSTLGGENETFKVYFYVGASALALISTFNALSAAYIVRGEMQRKPKIGLWAKDHRFAFGFFLALAPIKSNGILFLDTHLFQSSRLSETFNCPLPHKLRTKFRIASVVQLIGEDLTQAFLVLLLTTRLLGGWTLLNSLSFGCSCMGAILHVYVNGNELNQSYNNAQQRKLKSATAMDEISPSAQSTPPPEDGTP